MSRTNANPNAEQSEKNDVVDALEGRWTSHESVDDQRRCQGCGKHVSNLFRRCYGDENGTVHACPDCSTYRDLEDDAIDAPAAGGDRA